jgi:hypothetical protein
MLLWPERREAAMGFREKIEDRIARKEQEIRDYEAKVAEARAYLQGLQDAFRMMPRESSATPRAESAEGAIRPGSKIHKTFELLKREGKPVHVTEILRGIGVEPTKKARVSLSGSLGWYVRRNEVFNRPAPNTFGLIETVGGSFPQEPPEGFGQDASESGESTPEVDEGEDIPF